MGGYTLDDDMVCGVNLDHVDEVTYDDAHVTEYRCVRCGAEWDEPKS